MRYTNIDTDNLRIKTRPKKTSRPRTKIRPKHDDAVNYTVIGVDRGRYHLTNLSDSSVPNIVAIKARELPKGSIVIGDSVAVVGDLSGKKDTLARIVKVNERKTELMRSSDETSREKLIVANASTMVIVVALANPTPRMGMIDRCLVAAYNANMKPILCLTKSDLASPEEFMNFYTPLGIESFVTEINENGVIGTTALEKRLENEFSVFVGHSGVGKSTLINELIPEANRDTGHVNIVTGKGRHTSTSAVALQLPKGGWVVDTPGVRAFGLAHLSVENVINAFDDLSDLIQNCPKGCKHSKDDLACELHLETDENTQLRIESLRRILETKE
ncbi:ribosome small subunit-dependent GTPase A [Actinomyces sp. zg-332]|uniref:ribosome small subunit-dependent GTPase A n=1 Tax=Actinomyces sp. zg-332 TaxID=2708340 RepID=UPI0014217864|nr:ribosome small subunit-dependent GTPase A [Actinomyces sp. zg-332]QPK94394.1 ribosome small subunit-dependent GTPase A [Actinomyces sp. zg-332]